MKLSCRVLFHLCFLSLSSTAQTVQIPSSWFSADPKSVLSDLRFHTLPSETRIEILSQIDPKFAKLNLKRKEQFLWEAETQNLPKAPTPEQHFIWRPSESSSTSKITSFSQITKVLSAGGFIVEASIQRAGFFIARIRIVNQSGSPVKVVPQTFVLDGVKPNRKTLYFEYPSRVSAQYRKAGLNQRVPFIPTERTTVRTASGQTVATIDTPDHDARKEFSNMAHTMTDVAFLLAENVGRRSLKEAVLGPREALEGDVYFEGSRKVHELVLKLVLAESGFEIPFSFPKQ